MRHRGGAWREDREVGAALALELELRAFEAFTDLVVADLEVRLLRHICRVLEARDLAIAVFLQVGRCGRVVPVAVDDHVGLARSAGRGSGPGSYLVSSTASKPRRPWPDRVGGNRTPAARGIRGTALGGARPRLLP